MLYTAELLKATRTAKDSLIVAGKAWDATAKTETLWEIRTKLISAGVDSDDFPPFHAAAIETLLDEVDDRSGCTEGRYDDVLEALVAANDRAQRITSRAAGNGDTTAAPVFLAAVTECQAGSKASETGGNPMLSEVHTFSTTFKGGKGYSFDAAALRKCGITDPNEIAELISLSEPAAGSEEESSGQIESFGTPTGISGSGT